MVSDKDKKLPYCASLVRERDPARFFLALLMKRQAQLPLMALYAFNYEVAKTREIVTDTTLGLIRLQWWRDAVSEIYDGKSPRENGILPILAEAIKTYGIPKDSFENLIYAREFDLEDILPADLTGMKNYAQFTNAPLNAMALQINGEYEENAETLNRISIVYGLLGLLRSFAFHASQGRCYMPANMLAKHHISERNIYEFTCDEAELSSFAKGVADEIEKLIKETKKPKTHYLKKINHINRMNLNLMKMANYNLLSTLLADLPPFYQLRLATGF